MFSHAPILVVIIPLIGAFLTPIINIIQKRYGKKGACGYFALGVLLLTSLLILDVAFEVWNGEIIVYELAGRSPPLGINLAIDGLAVQMAFMIGVLGPIVTGYSISFMNEEKELGLFYTLILSSISGMLGIVLTGDLFNLFVFLEIMSISTYALIAIYKDLDSLVASLKYLFIGTLESTFILLSIGFIYGTVGSLNIADIGAKLRLIQTGSQTMPSVMIVAFGLFVTAILIKTGMFPFHSWLVDAIASAPTPISALIAGPQAVIGIYLIARIPYLPFGSNIGSILIAFGLVGMIAGVLMALNSSEFKRMLGYHVISQKGWMVLGLGIGTVLGVEGGLYHLLNHSTYKSLLLMSAGFVVLQLKTQKFENYGGLLKKMPTVAGLFFVGSLAIAGIPPLNGFVSKFTVYMAGWNANLPVLTFLAILTSLGTLASFFKAFKNTFLGGPLEECVEVERLPIGMLIPMIILAAICVILGILPSLGFDLVGPAQTSILGSGADEYINAVLSG